MPNRKKWLEEHEVAVKEQVAKGLGSRRIAKLKLAILRIFSESAINGFISRAGLANPVRSLRIKKSRRLTQKKKERLIRFLRGKGKNMPDTAVARCMEVSEQSAYWFRIKTIGKVEGKVRRKSKVTEAMRRKKISLSYMHKRIEAYENLCALQTKKEEEKCHSKLRACRCCGAKRFASGEFFHKTSCRSKQDGHAFLYGMCRICTAEIGGLKRMGKKSEELDCHIARFFEKRSEKNLGELTGLLKFHTREGLRYKWKTCRHCRKRWPWNWQYFHQVPDGSDVLVIDTCLACPAIRRFFSK